MERRHANAASCSEDGDLPSGGGPPVSTTWFSRYSALLAGSKVSNVLSSDWFNTMDIFCLEACGSSGGGFEAAGPAATAPDAWPSNALTRVDKDERRPAIPADKERFVRKFPMTRREHPRGIDAATSKSDVGSRSKCSHRAVANSGVSFTSCAICVNVGPAPPCPGVLAGRSGVAPATNDMAPKREGKGKKATQNC